MKRHLILSTVALATLSLTACGANDTDTAYLGSRDDIIVNNRNMPKSATKEEIAAKVETVQTDADAKAREMAAAELASKRIEAQDAVVAEANKAVDAMDATKVSKAEAITTMKTTPKGIVETTTATSVASTEPAAASAAAVEPVIPASMQGDVPPNARPGECYAKVLIPAVRDSKSERVQVSEERKVLARIIPAKYEVQTERIQVSEEKKVLARIVPARYEVQTERVLVTPARKYWKAGQGPITKKDEVTGEIMCLVEEPAVYKTIEKRVMVSEEKPEYKMVPAEFKTIEKRVLVTPEKPEYKMMPAQFDTITKSVIVRPESWEWRRILCETNMGSDSVARIQRALNSKGYNVKIDGKLGNETMSALSAYQRKNNLATRGITYETLEHMGVRLIGA